MIKVYPSSSAFARGLNVYTKFNSGCLRKIQLNAAGHREELKQDTKDLGAKNEEEFEKNLQCHLPHGTTYAREVPVVSQLAGPNGPVLSGRADFITYDDNGPHVIELKSTQSATKRLQLSKGELAPENLAQLIAYAVEIGATTGELRYTFYNLKKNTKEDHSFAVRLIEDGSIEVNGGLYEFTVHEYLRHRELAIHYLTNPIVAPRPLDGEKPFSGACGFCAFKDRCKKLDQREISYEQFVAK